MSIFHRRAPPWWLALMIKQSDSTIYCQATRKRSTTQNVCSGSLPSSIPWIQAISFLAVMMVIWDCGSRKHHKNRAFWHRERKRRWRTPMLLKRGTRTCQRSKRLNDPARYRLPSKRRRPQNESCWTAGNAKKRMYVNIVVKRICLVYRSVKRWLWHRRCEDDLNRRWWDEHLGLDAVK